MEKKDLMIGDWVVFHTGYAKVTGITDAGIHFVDRFGGGIASGAEPIPLTAEILEKNGFKFESPCINDNKDAWVYEWPNEKPNYTPNAFLLMSHHNKAEFPNFWIYAPNNPEIVYVHELQHALRVCNVDKEIEL